MLRTLFFLGVAFVVGSFVLSFVLGVAGAILGFAVKILVLGAIAYLAIRIISPSTAAQLRGCVERHTLKGL
jgi:hypothetical protein